MPATIEYVSLTLAQQLNVPLVTIQIIRRNFDPGYVEFLLRQLQSGQFDECLGCMIELLDQKGIE